MAPGYYHGDYSLFLGIEITTLTIAIIRETKVLNGELSPTDFARLYAHDVGRLYFNSCNRTLNHSNQHGISTILSWIRHRRWNSRSNLCLDWPIELVSIFNISPRVQLDPGFYTVDIPKAVSYADKSLALLGAVYRATGLFHLGGTGHSIAVQSN
ncbi:hypothetical protein BS50DRAFT_620816 [Corynespora cassiicola Philippines]|uniref:Uncharacterized protein n=1 Tax=Corynespora cassiicola Philippines TaxID=1448308 RepID=A0A2T2NMB8_CORCC|nr:hypothetical protein BS50DRAFT_620816 [Corynespora cassiicola Philippines]